MRDTEDPDFFIQRKGIFFPPPLKRNDKIAILSPASAVKEEYVLGAMARIAERGYEPILMPHAIGHDDGSFSATRSNRLSDLFKALEDPDIKAILCARGGYGCVQILVNFSYGLISKNPKWIIGFSDVSALLAMWYRSDIASIHGPMAKHLATEDPDDLCTQAFFNILERGGKFDYYIPSSPLNLNGEAKGVLRGGNFAVLNGLADTPYDVLNVRGEEDVILFFEDISEAIYAVERMLYRLFYNGTINRVKGLIFGKFTEYRPDRNFRTMEEMISAFLSLRLYTRIPVVFDFPVGHVKENFPLTVGAEVSLEVTPEGVSLRTV